MKLKRYLLFGGGSLISSDGGWGDFCGSFDTIDQAKEYVDESEAWASIVDGEISEIVWSYIRDDYGDGWEDETSS